MDAVLLSAPKKPRHVFGNVKPLNPVVVTDILWLVGGFAMMLASMQMDRRDRIWNH
ncbi:hypothetical protein [Chitiniphilus shinanonensis]|uniref:hypothetical protein n=1 Tax=Chitiniphilus shinanonensis TaxID=553088 RepID=UPI001B7FD70C|nr:hypothetical protein [Chitiniphilus shinanonensis]